MELHALEAMVQSGAAGYDTLLFSSGSKSVQTEAVVKGEVLVMVKFPWAWGKLCNVV